MNHDMHRAKGYIVRTVFFFALVAMMVIMHYVYARNGLQDKMVSVSRDSEWNFPSVHIQMDGYIDRYIWTRATVDSFGGTDSSYRFEGLHASVRGRGNSSWGYGLHFGKVPFRLRFDEPVVMPGADHAARNWTFINNITDFTLMRNYGAYYLAFLLDGMDFAPFSNFIHLYINEEYMGVYQLCIQINEILYSPNGQRVYLQQNVAPELSEYLLELCFRLFEDASVAEGLDFIVVDGAPYQIRFPNNNTYGHAEYVKRFMTRVYTLLRDGDPEVLNYICMDSFIDHYIVQEVYKNYDIGALSTYFQIRGMGEERRLIAGPVWDFDHSAGNVNSRGPRANSPYGIFAAYAHRWYMHLILMPEFRDALASRWNAIRDVEIAQWLNHIEDTAIRYQRDFERNFYRWDNILGIGVLQTPQNLREIDTFMGHVVHTMDWFRRRVAWLDDFFNDRITGWHEGGVSRTHYIIYYRDRHRMINGIYEIDGHQFIFIGLQGHLFMGGIVNIGDFIDATDGCEEEIFIPGFATPPYLATEDRPVGSLWTGLLHVEDGYIFFHPETHQMQFGCAYVPGLGYRAFHPQSGRMLTGHMAPWILLNLSQGGQASYVGFDRPDDIMAFFAFDYDGRKKRGEWVQVTEGYEVGVGASFACDDSGEMVRNMVYTIEGTAFYFNEHGIATHIVD